MTTYLLDGVKQGERLLYLTGEPGRLDDLCDLPDRDGLLASGQLVTMSVDEPNGPGGEWDTHARLDCIRRLSADAGRAGYPGLRLAAEATSHLRIDEPSLLAFELMFDELVAGSPTVAMCGFAGSRISGAQEDMLCFVHPLCRRFGLDTGVHLYADGAGGWRLTGGVDLTNAGHLATALAALPPDDVHLRLDGLRFCDAAATRVLVGAAAARHPAARLILHDAPPLVRRVLALGWPGENPGLVVLPDRAEARPDRAEAKPADGGATNEVLSNAVTHGRPPVGVRVWASPTRVTVAVDDRGRGVPDPYAGLVHHPGNGPGDGLRLARRLCDQLLLVTRPDGFTVYLTTNDAPR